MPQPTDDSIDNTLLSGITPDTVRRNLSSQENYSRAITEIQAEEHDAMSGKKTSMSKNDRDSGISSKAMSKAVLTDSSQKMTTEMSNWQKYQVPTVSEESDSGKPAKHVALRQEKFKAALQDSMEDVTAGLTEAEVASFRVHRNPFKLPESVDIFTYKERESEYRKAKRKKNLLLPASMKTTANSRRASMKSKAADVLARTEFEAKEAKRVSKVGGNGIGLVVRLNFNPSSEPN